MSPILKRALWGLLAVVVIVGLAWPKLPDLRADTAEAAPAARPSDTRLRVNAQIITEEALDDRILATGTLLANEQVDLTAETSGKVTQILFEEGRAVRAGALLVKINDEQLQARYRQAEYRLRLAESRETRQQALLDKGGISQQEYDETLNELNVLRAELELIDAEIRRTEVRAPFDGVVGLRYVSDGAYISPTTRIATLQDLGSIKVEFSIPERYANRVQVGDEIVFRVVGQTDPYTGRVFAYEPTVDPNTRTVRLRARAANPGGVLRPGLFADVELVFETIEDALTVPTIAVIPELGGQKLYVYQNGQAMPRQVETGIRLADRVQIVSGLAPQDTVLTSGIQQLRPGLPVTVGLPATLTGD
ncbi:MAG: efflux RND transporter periplasmic adaptor subunit [Bacteroidota bacterium]